MALLRKQGLLHKVTCGCSIVATLLISTPGSLEAAAKKRPTLAQKAEAKKAADAQKAKSETPPADAAAAPTEQAAIRLNFLSATWPDVLQKLAKETGSTLVMQETPPGRFSRTDMQKYGKTEAVRILNRALEPKGFRIVEKNQYLIVLHLDDVRSQYKRPVIRDNSDAPQTTDKIVDIRPKQEAAAAPKQTEITDVTPRKGNSRPAVTQAAATESEDTPPRKQRGAIRQASHDSENAAAIVEQAIQKPAAHPAETSITSVVSLEHGDAAYVAKVLYTALKDRSELIDEGPKGLPGFRTFTKDARAGEAKGERRSKGQARNAEFTVGIDSDRQELIVEAPEKLGTQIEKVFHEIDAAQQDDALALRVVSATDKALSISRNLQPELMRLSAQSHRDRGREEQFAQQEGQPQQPQGEQPKQQGNLSEMIQNLGGDVTIESMPDAGVLILRGNPKDVEQVMKVIREIEKLSAGSVPDVRVHPLKHVNSDSFAALLNSVYERLTTMRSRDTDPRQPVYFFSVAKPNAVLILAPPADMATILQLVNQLDQPVDPTTEFEVFTLQNAVATQVVGTLTDLYKTTNAEGQEQALKPRVSVYADVRTNSVIVQARPRDLEEVAALIKKIDRDESGAVSKMRIFRLENSSAEEVANVINTALQSILNPNQGGTRTTGGGGGDNIGGGNAGGGNQGRNNTGGGTGGSGGGQTTQQLREAKSVMLEFMSSDGDSQRVVRSGVLADIRVTADPRLNNLVVTAPEQSMQLIAELIKQLDHPADVVAEIKVYTLNNGDAANMVRLLEALFAGRLGNQQNQQQNLGIDLQLSGAQDSSSMLVPLKFSVDPRTNSVIAVGGADAQRAVEAVILRLDAGEVRQRKNEVIKLKNSPALEVAEAINQFLQSQRELAQLDPDLVSNVEFLEREIIAVAETVSNSLLISATPRYFDEIKKIVARLDEAPPQVVIQALLVEVDLQNTDEFGLELGFQDSVLFDRSIIDSIETITQTTSNPATGIATSTQQIVSQQATPGFLFNNNPLGNNPAINSSSVGKQALSNFSLGRTNNELGFGGLVLSAGSESVSVLLRALSAQRTINILSRPQIRTLDNQEATIQVGQQVPIVNGVTPNALGGIQSPIVVQDNAGIILTVKPRISPEGLIVMETIAEKSQFAGGSVPIFTDATTGNVITSPIKDITIAHSTVSIPNGQTIVMGGMITKTDNTLNRKVPWLGDLPLVGRAFRFDSTTTRRTELLIFLTPRVIKNDQDNELIKQVEAERIHFIEADAEAIHGPLFAVPQESGVITPQVPMQTPTLNDGAVLPVPPVPMLPPETPEGEGQSSNVPTTIMPGAAFESTEPLLLEAGGTSESDPKQ